MSGTTTYFYNARNLLESVTLPDLSIVNYAYDHEGNRTQKDVNGTVTNYLIDSNRRFSQVVAEHDGSGNLIASYTYGDSLLQQTRSGVTSYYMSDGLGSTRLLLDNSATVTDSYTYSAFGSLISSTGTTANNYLFHGEFRDDNLNQYYLRARNYDPALGRMTTTDPFEGYAANPVTLHRYLAANDNPVMFVDPSGEFSLGSVMTSIGIMGTLNAIATPSFAEIKSSIVNKIVITEAKRMTNYAIMKLFVWGEKDKESYKTWFGKINSKRKEYVEKVYDKISSALNKTIIFHKTSKSYCGAAVPYGPLEIWLGKCYFAASLTGVDSKAGILVHELSHEVSNTDDFEYGISASKKLAIKFPTKAIKNADNYEYFAEGAK